MFPLAYGDGQVVWGSRNLRFRLMVHLLLWQKSSKSTTTKAAISLLLKFRAIAVVILGQSLSKQLFYEEPIGKTVILNDQPLMWLG